MKYNERRRTMTVLSMARWAGGQVRRGRGALCPVGADAAAAELDGHQPAGLDPRPRLGPGPGLRLA
jgi:hypothetical protein